MNERMKYLLSEVHRDNSAWFPMASRFYGGEYEEDINQAASKGWVEVSYDTDGISGDFATVIITRAGRRVIGAPDPKPGRFKAWLFSILKHT